MAGHFTGTKTITGTTSYAASADFSPGFEGDFHIFQNRGDNTVYASFDGVNDHLETIGGEAVSMPARHRARVWVRDGGGSGDAIVRYTTATE